jgi:uncharacterized membrane protein
MLIALPFGLFIAVAVFDAVYLWRGSPAFATTAYWNIAAGIVGGLLAAALEAIDWFAFPAAHERSASSCSRGSNVVVVLVRLAGWPSRR